MDNFKNVDVDILANIYFEGKVISRNIFLKDDDDWKLTTYGMDFNIPSNSSLRVNVLE